MLMRTTLLACAMVMATAVPATAEEAARCEATNFRVYFAHGAAALDTTTLEVLEAAERNVAGCDYAELRVSLDGANPQAAERADAIRAAANEQAWDDVRIEHNASLHRVSYGPEYAEITMTPERSTTPAQPLPRTETGV